MIEDAKYSFMTRKELAVAGDINERTLYNYMLSQMSELVARGYKKHKKLPPSVVRYICENYEVHLHGVQNRS